MRLTDFLDKGASLGPAAPCLTMAGESRSYAEVQRLSPAMVRHGAAGSSEAPLSRNSVRRTAAVPAISAAR